MQKPIVSYIICSTFRSGSWMLSEALEGTNLAGRPREYLEPPQLKAWQGIWDLAAEPYSQDYFQAMIISGTTRNGVFGLKMHRPACRQLLAVLREKKRTDCSDVELLDELLPNLKFVWLSRFNKVRQAISWYRACQTGKWWSLGGLSPSEPSCSLVYRYGPIQELVSVLERCDLEWDSMLTPHPNRFIKVYYEDMLIDLDSTIQRIVTWLRIPSDERVLVPEPRLCRQSDPETEQWVKFFLEHGSSRYREYESPWNSRLTK